MVLDHSIDDILHQRGFPEWASTSAAVECAVLGEVDAARDITTLLYMRPNVYFSSTIERRLTFAWVTTGRWPEGIKPSAMADETIADLYTTLPSFASPHHVQDQSIQNNEVSLAAVLAFSGDLAQEPRIERWANYEMTLTQLKALDISLKIAKGNKPIGRSTMEYKSASDLLDPRSRHLVDGLARHLSTTRHNHGITDLAEFPLLWPALAKGLLVDILELDRSEIATKARALVEAVQHRTTKGRTDRPYANWPMAELVRIADENTQKNGDDEFGLLGDRARSFLHAPASAADITALEERLGAQLPADFKDFLSFTNGYGESGWAMHKPYVGEPPFHSTDKINWLDEDYLHLLPLHLLELPMGLTKRLAGRVKWDDDVDRCSYSGLPNTDRVLEIAVLDIENRWLIPPALVRKSRDTYQKLYEGADATDKRVIDLAIDEFAGGRQAWDDLGWVLVTWASGGAAEWYAYSSFRSYMEDCVRKSKKRTPMD